MKLYIYLFTALFVYGAAAQPPFYSYAGSENRVSFRHSIETMMTSLTQVENMSASDRLVFVRSTVRPLLKFLYGPLTRRSIGNPQRDDFIEVLWEQAHMEAGLVHLPILYKATWLLEQSVARRGTLTIPVPRARPKLLSPKWKRCTDSALEHATEGFYWYFWDPERYGCDHREGIHYDEVEVKIGDSTVVEAQSFPEYERMIRMIDGKEAMTATFAFGYVEDPANPRPDRDSDPGAGEYRAFLNMIGSRFPHFSAKPLRLNTYKDSSFEDRVIGYAFSGSVKGVQMNLNVVMAAGIDQIYIFAKSFAHDHDSLFAWMGHSRVGGGFDAEAIRRIMRKDPSYYSITDQYQLIYWGGCNSYSYYTLPFFEFKAEAFPESDPHGTRGLDIVAHGLPSYFALNAENGGILLNAFLSWPLRISYQQIIRDLEASGNSMGATLLAVVLGDEDNANGDLR